MASLLGQRVSYRSQSTGMKQEYWVVGARVLTKSMVNLLIVRPCPTDCCGGQTPTLKDWIPWCYQREPWLQEQERMTIFGKLHGCTSRLGVLTATENKIFGISWLLGMIRELMEIE